MPELENTGVTVEEGGTSDVKAPATTTDFFADFDASMSAPGEDSTATTDSAEGAEDAADAVASTEGDQGVDTATALREEIARMASVMASHGITFTETTGETVTEPETPVTPATPQTPVQPTAVWGPTVTVSDEDFQNSLENKATFEKLLTTVRDQAVERSIQSIPQLVTSMIKQQLYLNELSREFYQANEDLAGIRPFVGVVANEIASKNPGLGPEEVLKQTAVEARKRMQLKVKTEASVRTTTPGLPNATTRQKVVQSNLTGLEKDLSDLMSVQ